MIRIFPIWQNTDLPTGNGPTHWDGVFKAIRGTTIIDGVIDASSAGVRARE